ncbi:hypothetical protein NDU88_008681 [Pleurodeles waltl]|uniref:Uncharacterized protein n=1 Tax=Pleurodeles waltl TaxID=8319 RepID=A0AAV7RTY8_PLEWA|nr:hypothetical protein NDU88_008681 [Pleurodeles waltl]
MLPATEGLCDTSNPEAQPQPQQNLPTVSDASAGNHREEALHASNKPDAERGEEGPATSGEEENDAPLSHAKEERKGKSHRLTWRHMDNMDKSKRAIMSNNRLVQYKMIDIYLVYL